MQKLFSVAIVLGFLTMDFSAWATSYECNDTFEIGTSQVEFNSTIPSLKTQVTMKEPGHQPQVLPERVLLSADMICGEKVIFSENCKSQEQFSEKFGYDFTFQCSNGIRGEVYFDEIGGGSGHCTYINGQTENFVLMGECKKLN